MRNGRQSYLGIEGFRADGIGSLGLGLCHRLLYLPLGHINADLGRCRDILSLVLSSINILDCSLLVLLSCLGSSVKSLRLRKQLISATIAAAGFEMQGIVLKPIIVY